MSHKSLADVDTIYDKELTELLVKVKGTTPEEIERGAAEIDIAPPEEATAIGVDE